MKIKKDYYDFISDFNNNQIINYQINNPTTYKNDKQKTSYENLRIFK